MLELVTPHYSNPETTNFLSWGIIAYDDALREQLDLMQKVYERKLPNTIIFCSHQPIVTRGRATPDADIFGWKGETLDVQRGGRATYHGPNQLVVYPIVNLQNHQADGSIKTTGVRDFFRALESAVVSVLKSYEIPAEGRCGTKVQNDDESLEATGVWVGERKICSIGIGVKKWVTYHGLALNLDYDPEAFKGLNPCGFSPQTMISVEEILGKKISRQEVINRFKEYFLTERFFRN